MGREDIKDVLKEWNYYELPEIKDRKLNPLEFLNWKLKKIISLVGFRRTGKTFLLLSIAKRMGKENAIYVNFEDKRLCDIDFSDFLNVLREVYGNKKMILLLDEVQNIDDWGRWLRTLNDLPDYFIFATGSSSKISLEEIPTELRGRTLSLRVFPLDFEEFLNFKGKSKEIPRGFLFKYLEEYLTFGGLPEIVLENNNMKKMLMAEEYFNTFVARDVIEKYDVENKKALNYIIRYLINSSYLTYSKLYNSMKSCGYKIGKGTVIDYTNYIERSFFAYFLPIYSSVKKQEQYPRKVYIIDNIFLRFGINMSFGRLMENLVFVELLRRKCCVTDFQFNYFQTRGGYEVDFLIKEGLRVKQLIQVTYANSFDEVEHREIRALLKAKEMFKEDNPELLIITWDYEDEKELSWFGKKGKIKFVPLWKWLLKDL